MAPRMIDVEIPIDVAIGRNLYSIRRAAGVSQMDLAVFIGCSDALIQKYESGIGRVHLSRALRLCDRLDCNLEDLLQGVTT